MDPRDTPQEAAFRAEVRAWLEEHAPPYRERYQKAQSSKERLDVAAQWQGEIFEAGYGAIGWPEEYGGRPGTAIEKYIVAQEQAEVGVPWHLNMTVTIGYTAITLLNFGSQELKDRHLPKILRGQEIWCQLFSEPNAGSDLAAVSTNAQRMDGEYIVNGQKIWSSGAHWAKYGILLARTDPQGPRYRNLSFFMIDMSSPGIDVRPITQISGERDFCEVFFTDARVPEPWRLGDEGMGWQVAIFTLLNERVALSGGTGPMMLARQAWGRLLEVARQRTIAGRPAIEDPRVRQKLAQLYVNSACGNWTAARAMNAVFKGAMPGPEASIMKLGADANMQFMQDVAAEILGLNAVMMDDPRGIDGGLWAKGLLTARAMTIGGGTTEVQKNIIGERVLGLPRDPSPKQETR